MFCPSCGSQQPDNASFCSSCGAKFQNEATQAPQQTVFQPSAAQQAPYQPPVFQAPRPKTAEDAMTSAEKNAGKLCLLTFVLSLLLVATSILAPLNGDLLSNFLVNSVVEMSGASIDELRDELSDGIDKAEESLDKADDAYHLSSSQKECIEEFLESAKNLNSCFSLLNLRDFATVSLEAMEELEDAEDFGYNFDFNKRQLEQSIEALDILIYVIIGFFAFPLLFTLLAGLLRNRGLTITALVFTVLTQLLLCGVIWAVLSLAVFIAQFIFCGMAKNAKLKRQLFGAV